MIILAGIFIWISVMTFSQAITHQEVGIAQPVINKITNLDADYRSDTNISISFDHDMKSPVEGNSEQIKENNLNQLM